MSQIGGGISTVQSLGAGRHRDIPQDLSVSIGTSISSRFDSSEWEARESQRQRELEETRARAAQMEKTMKWWSDCTANWREKWSKVRNERNKSRDEAKQLRTSLEAAIKESNLYKREKNDLEIQIIQLKKEMENIHMLLIKQSGHFHKSIQKNGEKAENDNRDINCAPVLSSEGFKNLDSDNELFSKFFSDSNCLNIEEHILQGAISNNLPELTKEESAAEEKHLIQQLSKNESDEEYLLQKISVLQLKLDEAQKLYQIEKEEKYSLHKNIEKLSLEMREMKEKYDEMREAKQEAVRELLTLQEQHRAEVRILNNTLQEEISSRENFERRLCELRNELERLQSENALEWGKRERLETEKIGLERDNKKLRTEIREMMGRCDKKGRPISNTDLEIQTLQTELTERNKEISEIKHSHIKLQKVLAEANTELGHAVRRAEQYETEVKRLRTRIEELKGELAGAEDELDVTCNQVRRLQRINEELSEKTEDLQVQVQHLQTKDLNSPKQQNSARYNNSGYDTSDILDADNKPSINDLRQIFDDKSNRKSNRQLKSNMNSKTTSSNYSYCDAKQTHYVDKAFESKPRNTDFVKAIQKFDNLPSQRERLSFGNKFLNVPNHKPNNFLKRFSYVIDSNQRQVNNKDFKQIIKVYDDHSLSSLKNESLVLNSTESLKEPENKETS